MMPTEAAAAFTIAVPDAVLGGVIVGPPGARPLLVVHGGPGESHDVLRPHLDALASSQRRVVYYDQRGGLRSSLADGAQPGDWKRHVMDLDAVRGHLGGGAIDVLGFSWGALLSLLYVLEERSGVARLVLVSPPPLYAGAAAVSRRQLEAVRSRPAVRAVEERARRVAAEARDPAALMRAQFVARVAAALADPMRAWDLTPVETRDDVAGAVWDSLGAYDLRERLESLHGLPVLIVAGAQDPGVMATVGDTAGRLAAQLVLIPGCGHAPFFEDPEAFRATVEAFLASPDRGPT